MIKDTDRSIENFGQVFWTASDLAKFYYNRGSVYLKNKDHDNAINNFMLAIEKDSHNTEYYAALIASEINKYNGDIHRGIEETKKAIISYRSINS